MKYVVYTFLVVFVLLSCRFSNRKETIAKAPVRELTKLEKLLQLPHDSVMATYDLSNDSIIGFPDLSGYTIKSLDLSYNLLDTIIPQFLPEGLEKLNLSHNRYRGNIRIKKNAIPTLKELDMSHNTINRIDISEPLYRILLAYNDLTYLGFNNKNIQYLDISYNTNMSEEVGFEPLGIDTILREGVANGKRLIGPVSGWAGYHF